MIIAAEERRHIATRWSAFAVMRGRHTPLLMSALMINTSSPIAIVGAGQAGASLGFRLRALGYNGAILLIGEEPVLPYQRPPLSKKYMMGMVERDQLLLRPRQTYADQQIEVVTGRRVDKIDPDALSVTLDDGRHIRCSAIALTTGASAIRLSDELGGKLRGVYSIRDLGDADALALKMKRGKRLLIVGGGYIGLEAAAVAASNGLSVVLVEREPRILSRVACSETAAWFRARHKRAGVTFYEGLTLSGLEGEAGHVCKAHFSDGSDLDVDFVIVGIGGRPSVDLAREAGAKIENGIACDAQGRTSVPGIFAAGDCASFPWRGRRVRLESVPSAIGQAEAVAATILGQETPYIARPWFWSDQYETKLQIAGLGAGYDRIIVRPGERSDSVSHWYYAGDSLLAVDAINDARAHMIGRRLLDAGQSPTPIAVADTTIALTSLPLVTAESAKEFHDYHSVS
jgi:3-phenylpropionate/trans-cinnamate dioxygenase ferredoxin reductase subunit